jgi:hypothetical protein
MNFRYFFAAATLLMCLFQTTYSMNFCKKCCTTIEEGATEVAGDAWLYIQTQARFFKQKFLPELEEKLNQVLQSIGKQVQEALLKEVDGMLGMVVAPNEARSYNLPTNITNLLLLQQQNDLQNYAPKTIAIHLKYLFAEKNIPQTNRNNNYNENNVKITMSKIDAKNIKEVADMFN